MSDQLFHFLPHLFNLKIQNILYNTLVSHKHHIMILLIFVEMYVKITQRAKVWFDDMLLCNRLKQFRKYNKLDCKLLAEILGISEEEYNDLEANKATPTIDMIQTLSMLYKVTVEEFYGSTPRLSLHSEENDMTFEDVDENTLKMADLSWDEAQLILYYRTKNGKEKEDLVKKILEKSE